MNSTFRSYGETIEDFRNNFSMVIDAKLHNAVKEYAKSNHVSMASVYRDGAIKILTEANYLS